MTEEIQGRYIGFDFLKIIATIMVIVLHVNGFLTDGISLASFSCSTNIIWHVSEAIAYPAIHIFVMITAWFAVDRKFSVKGIVNAWCQTWCVCIFGLICALVFRYDFGLKGLFAVVFPFAGRAYWFVTDYIILMFFSPALNMVIKKCTNKQLISFTTLLFVVESVFACCLSTLNWNQDYSNIGLFILLYFMSGVLKRNINNIPKIGGAIWGISFGLLIGSYGLLHCLGFSVHKIFMEKEMIFYQYNSPFVIFEAVGLTILFAKINIKIENVLIKRIINIFVNASLAVYLVHMHPILKQHYVSLGVLSWLNVCDLGIYLIETIFCVGFIFLTGVICSIPITKVSRFVCCKLDVLDVLNEK